MSQPSPKLRPCHAHAWVDDARNVFESRTFTRSTSFQVKNGFSSVNLCHSSMGNDNRGIDSTAGHNLRSLFERVIDQFTETPPSLPVIAIWS